MIKTTESEFKEFKTLFMGWVRRFGLYGWTVYFRHEEVDGCFADINIDLENMVATVRFTTEIDDDDLQDYDLYVIAKHEVMHLFTAKLAWLANSRFATEVEIKSAVEEIANSLGSLIV